MFKWALFLDWVHYAGQHYWWFICHKIIIHFDVLRTLFIEIINTVYYEFVQGLDVSFQQFMYRVSQNFFYVLMRKKLLFFVEMFVSPSTNRADGNIHEKRLCSNVRQADRCSRICSLLFKNKSAFTIFLELNNSPLTWVYLAEDTQTDSQYKSHLFRIFSDRSNNWMPIFPWKNVQITFVSDHFQ